MRAANKKGNYKPLYYQQKRDSPDIVVSELSGEGKLFEENFTSAVENTRHRHWYRAAREDYRFYYGKQYSDADLSKRDADKKITLTINKVFPQVNTLAGYQILNRYENDFLPRHQDDVAQAEIRKAVTKYIYDETNFMQIESDVFLDAAICGMGWKKYGWKFDQYNMHGSVTIERISPFSMYVDPEARARDFSDAKYMICADWADKEELCALYPEKADVIKAQFGFYDSREMRTEEVIEQEWYLKNTKKARLCEYWWKETELKKFYVDVETDTILSADKVEAIPEMSSEELSSLPIVYLPDTSVKFAVFIKGVVLQKGDSPFLHGRFPYVPMVGYYTGEVDDVPAGIVRNIKDLQREINSKRNRFNEGLRRGVSQGWLIQRGVLTQNELRNFQQNMTKDGFVAEVGNLDAVKQINSAGANNQLIQQEREAVKDVPETTGINEAVMGSAPMSTSGKALEIHARQAIAQIALLFNNIRRCRLSGLKILWGDTGRKGLIPQYMTEYQIIRVIGDKGQHDFVPVNQPVLAGYNMSTGEAVYQTLNDLSIGDYDIVVSEMPNTATIRQAQLTTLVDFCQKLGIPGDMIFDIVVKATDIPEKYEILKRWNEKAAATQYQNEMARLAEAAARGPKYSAGGMAAQYELPPVDVEVPY